MKTNKLWVSATICLIFTCLWLVFMILSVASTGSINTFEEAISMAAKPGVLFYLSYINAALVTVTATVFFVSLYQYHKQFYTEWSLVGFVFVPVYCTLNLLVYISQFTIIPRLTVQLHDDQYSQAYEVLLGQLIQSWSGSAISVLNQLAYAVLGIPSIIFGILMLKHKKISRPAGGLLFLNGIFCILGLIGTSINNQLLASGSVIGGALFLFSLASIVMSASFRNHRDSSSS